MEVEQAEHERMPTQKEGSGHHDGVQLRGADGREDHMHRRLPRSRENLCCPHFAPPPPDLPTILRIRHRAARLELECPLRSLEPAVLNPLSPQSSILKILLGARTLKSQNSRGLS